MTTCTVCDNAAVFRVSSYSGGNLTGPAESCRRHLDRVSNQIDDDSVVIVEPIPRRERTS